MLRHPWVLLAAVPAAGAVLLLARRPREGLSAGRRRGAAALRVLGLLLAAAAAAGPHLMEASPRDRVLLVALHGAGPLPALAPGEGESMVVRAAPGAATAVAGVLALRPPGADARLVLATAGAGPDPAGAARALREAGVPAFVLPLPVPPSPPVREDLRPRIRGIRVPPGIAAGVPFRVEADLEPGSGAPATLSYLVDGRPVENPLVLSAGPHGIAARASAADGSPLDEVAATVFVPGPPSVLLVEEGEGPSPVARALEAQGIAVRRAAPGEPPPPPEGFSVVILGRGARGDRALEDAVRTGTGLLVLGGPDDAEGLGRLRGSPVAAALPVFLPPPPPPRPPEPEIPPAPPPEPDPPPGDGPGIREDEGERPGAVISLLLVVDCSGSMHGLKLEMARRAAAAAAATLAPVDRFGLLSFTADPRWELPLGPAGDTERLRAALRGLAAGGGTDLLPALREARRTMRREETAVRHVLVLSDGETSPFGLRDAVEALVGEGTTLSTVGIGGDYDARLLGLLASWGRGRTWPAIDPATLPQVVTLDTRRIVEAGAEAVKGRPVPDLPAPPLAERTPDPRREPPPGPPPEPPPSPVPAPVEEDEPAALVEGLGPWPPAVPPEAAPEPRLATTVALRFAGGRGPALVLGRHGLGRTAVLVPDPPGWAGWEGFAPAVARLVRGLAPAAPGSPVEVLAVEPGPEGTRVLLELRGDREAVEPVPGVEVLRPAGDSPAALPVERVGARRFAIVLPPSGPGSRTLVVGGEGPGEPRVPVGVFDPGPPPPKPPDPEGPARLAALAGVPLLDGPLPPPPPARPGEPREVPLAPWLAAAAALCLAADAGLRRWGAGGR